MISPIARNIRQYQKSLFLRKPGHTWFEGHQSAMKGPVPVLCLDLYSPDFIDWVKAMPPGERVCGVHWVQQSDQKGAFSCNQPSGCSTYDVLVTLGAVVETCCLYPRRWTAQHITLRSLCISISWIDSKIGELHQRLILRNGASLSSNNLRSMTIGEKLPATKIFSTI